MSALVLMGLLLASSQANPSTQAEVADSFVAGLSQRGS
jgi:hypothetical protein